MQILENYKTLQMLDYFEISQYLLQQKCYETSINSTIIIFIKNSSSLKFYLLTVEYLGFWQASMMKLFLENS